MDYSICSGLVTRPKTFLSFFYILRYDNQMVRISEIYLKEFLIENCFIQIFSIIVAFLCKYTLEPECKEDDKHYTQDLNLTLVYREQALNRKVLPPLFS